MTPQELCIHYPKLYHMAHVNSWPSIQRHGLLSTSALLDLYEIGGKQRRQIETTRRPSNVTISHPKYGIAVIRDQIPIREKALEACLVGLSPPQFFKLLNKRVFFWLTEARLKGLLNARAYRANEHCVLTIDTRSLLMEYAAHVKLAAINTGATLYNPPKRGADVFLPIGKYPFLERKKTRGVANAIAELTVEIPITDIVTHLRSAKIMQADKTIRVLHMAEEGTFSA